MRHENILLNARMKKENLASSTTLLQIINYHLLVAYIRGAEECQYLFFLQFLNANY